MHAPSRNWRTHRIHPKHTLTASHESSGARPLRPHARTTNPKLECTWDPFNTLSPHPTSPRAPLPPPPCPRGRGRPPPGRTARPHQPPPRASPAHIDNIDNKMWLRLTMPHSSPAHAVTGDNATPGMKGDCCAHSVGHAPMFQRAAASRTSNGPIGSSPIGTGCSCKPGGSSAHPSTAGGAGCLHASAGRLPLKGRQSHSRRPTLAVKYLVRPA